MGIPPAGVRPAVKGGRCKSFSEEIVNVVRNCKRLVVKELMYSDGIHRRVLAAMEGRSKLSYQAEELPQFKKSRQQGAPAFRFLPFGNDCARIRPSLQNNPQARRCTR